MIRLKSLGIWGSLLTFHMGGNAKGFNKIRRKLLKAIRPKDYYIIINPLFTYYYTVITHDHDARFLFKIGRGNTDIMEFNSPAYIIKDDINDTP